MIHSIFYFRSNSIVHSLNYPGKRLHCLTQRIFPGTEFCSRHEAQCAPFGSRLALYCHGLMQDGILKALIETAVKRPWMWQPCLDLRGGKKRKIHPSCNLAPRSSPLWQGGSDKSSFSAWAIRKRQRTWGRTAKRSITKHTARKPALRSTPKLGELTALRGRRKFLYL